MLELEMFLIKKKTNVPAFQEKKDIGQSCNNMFFFQYIYVFFAVHVYANTNKLANRVPVVSVL